MTNRLDRDYSAGALFRYTIPSILSLLFMSLYQMTDAFFIANFIGENALAAMNVVYPVISVMLAIALMFTTGGGAIVARKMGEGKAREAKEDFTVLMVTVTVMAAVFTLLCLLFMKPLLKFLGATPLLYEDSKAYLGTIVPFLPVAALQLGLSSFFVTAGKPGMGFFLTALSGGCNILLDYIFIVVLNMGIRGSALGTVAGYSIAAVPSLFYFLLSRKGNLNFVRPKFRPRMLLFSCFNGSSEMVSNLSVSVTTLLFNKIALRYMGEAGVTAVTVVLYAQFFLTAVFMGFISGASPIFSYNMGSGNKKRLNGLFRHCTVITVIMTGFVMAASWLLAKPIVAVYIRPESSIFPLALNGFRLFSISYLFTGFNIYASGLFTALHNGVVSAVISMLRTFLFLVVSLIGLPILIGADGIWLAVPAAEIVSFVVSVGFMVRYRKKYYFSFRLKDGDYDRKISSVQTVQES